MINPSIDGKRNYLVYIHKDNFSCAFIIFKAYNMFHPSNNSRIVRNRTLMRSAACNEDTYSDSSDGGVDHHHGGLNGAAVAAGGLHLYSPPPAYAPPYSPYNSGGGAGGGNTPHNTSYSPQPPPHSSASYSPQPPAASHSPGGGYAYGSPLNSSFSSPDIKVWIKL